MMHSPEAPAQDASLIPNSVQVPHKPADDGLDENLELKMEELSIEFESAAGSSVISQFVMSETGQVLKEPILATKHEIPFEFFGVEFNYSMDTEGVYIVHPQWPILGEGATFQEALEDLIRTLRGLRSQLLNTPLEELDKTAVEFRDYLLSKFSI